MEAKAFSLSTGGHCNTREETCFKRTFQKKVNVFRYEEGLGDQKTAEHQAFITDLAHSAPSSGSITALYSPAKVSANLYIDRLCSLKYVFNVVFSCTLIYLGYLIFSCITVCAEILLNTTQLILPTQHIESVIQGKRSQFRIPVC